MTVADSEMINLKLTSWHLNAAGATVDYFTTLLPLALCIQYASIQMGHFRGKFKVYVLV